MVHHLLFLATLLMAASSAHSARVLALLPIGGKSHHRFLQPVVMSLARAGHHVVLYSPFPSLLDHQPDNLTHVHLDSISVTDESANMVPLIQEMTSYPFWKCLDVQWNFMDTFYPELVNNKQIKELLSSNENFDLIITETFVAQEFITVLLSKKFKAPVIGLQSFPSNNIMNSYLGNSLSLSHIPDTCTVFSNKMSFVERLSNVFASVRGLYYHYNYYIPKQENMTRKDFPDAPPLEGLTEVVSLVFVNDHLTAGYAHPRTPNSIPVAGIHIQPRQPLPKDIKRFMDEAQNGVIFFSLGTYVLDDLQPEEYFKLYNNVFRKLKQRVLWKTRNANVAGLPSNVMTVTWAPQQDILAHPACVLFITHGGQLSRVETLHFGVPVVSIPQFFDQHQNSESYNHHGVGVRLARESVTEDNLLAAIQKVLYDPSYRENMKRLSAIFRDRPLSPAESVVFWTENVLRHGGAAHLRPASTELRCYRKNMKRMSAIFRDRPLSPAEAVVFWTEYVLRHGGAAHLRPASTELRWYQLILLDVFITLFFTISLLACIFIFVIKILLSHFKLQSKPLSNKKIN